MHFITEELKEECDHYGHVPRYFLGLHHIFVSSVKYWESVSRVNEKASLSTYQLSITLTYTGVCDKGLTPISIYLITSNSFSYT